MFGQINNILDTNLGSIFSQLNSIQGGGISLPSETFTKAIKFANIITNILDCDKVNCPETTSFSSKGGVTKSIEDSFDEIIDKLGLDRLTTSLMVLTILQMEFQHYQVLQIVTLMVLNVGHQELTL